MPIIPSSRDGISETTADAADAADADAPSPAESLNNLMTVEASAPAASPDTQADVEASASVTADGEVMVANSPRAAAEGLRARGYEPTRLEPGEKNPSYPDWTATPLDLDTIRPNHGVGIRTGWASDGGKPGHALVVLDIDMLAAVPTVHAQLDAAGIVSAMVDGHANKPDSHVWFLIPTASIPAEECQWPGKPPAAVAEADRRGIHRGCRKRRWVDVSGEGVFELLATGQQCACPPTKHHSGVLREWRGGARGEPAVVGYPKLRAALDAAAAELGAKLAGQPVAHVTTPHVAPSPLALTLDETEKARQCGLWLDAIPHNDIPCDANNGEAKSHRLARAVVNDFDLSPETALTVLMQRVEPRLVAIGEPWGEDGWRLRIEKALGIGDDPRYPRGCKLRAASNTAATGLTTATVNSGARSTMGRLVVKNAADIEPELIEWIVPEFIPAGMLTMVAGPGGRGKSTLTHALAAALSRGEPAFGLGYTGATKGKSLFVSTEDDWKSVITPRLIAMRADRSLISLVEGIAVGADGAIDFGIDHLALLESEIRHGGYKLVVLDPISDLIHSGSQQVDEHKTGEVRKFMRPLVKLARETGVAILIVSHTNKNEKAQGVNRVVGSGAFTTAVRAVYMIGPDPSDDNASGNVSVMALAKSNVGIEPHRGIRYRLQSVEPAEALALLIDTKSDDVTKAKLARQMSKPEWLGECRIPADMLNGPRKNEKAKVSKVDEAADFIVSFLGECAWPTAELDTEAHTRGLTPYTLKQAKEILAKLPTDNPRHLCRVMRYVPSRGWWAWLGDPLQPKNDRPLRAAA